MAGEAFQLQANARRHVINVEEVPEIVGALRHVSGVVTVAHPVSYSVAQIVRELEQITGRQAVFDVIDGGESYPIGPSLCVDSGEDYLRRILRHYYRDRCVPARKAVPEVC